MTQTKFNDNDYIDKMKKLDIKYQTQLQKLLQIKNEQLNIENEHILNNIKPVQLISPLLISGMSTTNNNINKSNTTPIHLTILPIQSIPLTTTNIQQPTFYNNINTNIINNNINKNQSNLVYITTPQPNLYTYNNIVNNNIPKIIFPTPNVKNYINTNINSNANNKNIITKKLALPKINNISNEKQCIINNLIKNEKNKNKINNNQLKYININNNKRTITTDLMRNNDKTKDKQYKCEKCGKSYKYLCNYRSHSKMHTDSAFVCQYCNKRFGRKSNYNEHLRIHTGEAPYKCSFCDRTFKQHHGWKDHLRTHTGEKPYLCQICGKRFTVGHNLNVHMRIHSGLKPYQCEICSKKYRQKSAYNSHMKNVHAINKKKE